MNRTEAKAYVLNELGLDRDQVRQFGNLSRTQTWLDAIAAQASGGIAAHEATPALNTTEIKPQADDNSFDRFWDGPSALLQPQPLVNISVLDEDWDDPHSQSSAIIIYPIVITLLLLWATVQLILFVGHWLGVALTLLANWLDTVATQRLLVDLRDTSLALG